MQVVARPERLVLVMVVVVVVVVVLLLLLLQLLVLDEILASLSQAQRQRAADARRHGVADRLATADRRARRPHLN